MLKVFVLVAIQFCFVFGTPLDDYVNKPDPYYKYVELESFKGQDYTMYVLNMTSQKWKSENVVDRPIWWHYLTVTIPDKINYTDSAFLFIDGGSNQDSPPKVTDTFVALTTLLAASTGLVGADLKMIPNQPISFKDDPQKSNRSEDAIIAWTWRKYIENTSDPEILLRMPMTKAAVRAMDTINDFVKKKVGNDINRFMVSGASKRGWTTWTTGAVDKRVIAMAPIVLDLLNIVKNLHHMYRNLGGWTFAFDDYYYANITADLDSPNIQKMAEIIDPIAYNDRYKTIPKYIITTGGDEFFQPDDAKYYFSELQGPKFLRNHHTEVFVVTIDNEGRLRTKLYDKRDDFDFPIVNFPILSSNIPAAPAYGVYISELIRYSRAGVSYQDFLDRGLLLTMKMFNQGRLPNAEHSCAGHETSLLFSLRSFILQVVAGKPFPQMQWTKEFTSNGGKITLHCDRTPRTVQVYYARTLDDKRRDFRLLVASPGDPGKPFPHPVIWFNDGVQSLGNNTYVAEYENPRGAWLAFFIQVTFDGLAESRLEFTTETLIIPDTFPFPDCHGADCKGTLV